MTALEGLPVAMLELPFTSVKQIKIQSTPEGVIVRVGGIPEEVTKFPSSKGRNPPNVEPPLDLTCIYL